MEASPKAPLQKLFEYSISYSTQNTPKALT